MVKRIMHGTRRTNDRAEDDAAPTDRDLIVDALPIDPFDASGRPDPVAVAETVVFKLWTDGRVGGRAIEQARKETGSGRVRLDRALVDLGCVDETEAADALAEALGAPRCRAADLPSAPVLADELPAKFLSDAGATPLHDDGSVLELAMVDPLDVYALRAIAMKTRRSIVVRVATRREIDRAVAALYGGAAAAAAAPARKTTELAEAFDARRADSARARASAQTSARVRSLSAGSGARLEPEALERRPFDADAEASDPFEARGSDRRATDGDDFDPIYARRDADFHADLDAVFDAELDADLDADLGARMDADRRDPVDLDALQARTAATKKFVRPKRVTLRDAARARRGDAAESRRRLDRDDASAFAEGARRAYDEDPLAIPDAADAREARRAKPHLSADARREALNRVRQALRAHAAERDETEYDAPTALPNGEAVRPARTRQAELRRRVDAAAEDLRPFEQPLAERAERPPLRREPVARRPISGRPFERGAPELDDRARALRAETALLARFDAVAAQIGRRSATRPPGHGSARIADMGPLSATDAAGPLVRHQLAAPVGAAPRRASRPARRTPDAADALDALSLPTGAKRALRTAFAAGDGLILICGPAGSGKVETLRAVAEAAAGPDADIRRFDDDADRGEGDRPDLRVGEIRDAETAETAARAAMRGEIVVATLDVPSVAAAAPRLTSLGLPPFVLASSLRAAIAQHLAPRRCPRCLGTGLRPGGGECPECGGTGVSGQVAIVEAMSPDDAIRGLILSQAPEAAFRHALSAQGERSLADDAADKVSAGIADPADVAFAAAAAAAV